MTGEHLWSDWMMRAKLLPRVAREYTETSNTYRRYTGDWTAFSRKREGSPANKKLKVVCKSCNNGWMGAIETAVIPILTRLIKRATDCSDPANAEKACGVASVENPGRRSQRIS